MSEHAYAAAGGDLQRLSLYGQLGRVQGLATPAGRVLASVNPEHEPVGALGDLSGDVSTIRAGEAWLLEQGCVAAQAPLQLATWFPYRANLGPFDEPPFLGEPSASPQPWIEAGYREVARYASAIAPNAEAVAYGESKRPEGISLRAMTRFEDDLPVIHALATASFRSAYAYSPLPLPAMAALYAPLAPHLVPELVLIATRDETPVGFVFGLPDLAQPGSGRFVVKTLAVLPEQRRSGLGAWLVGELHRVAEGLGFDRGIHALMWAGSKSRSISSHGGRVFREYALYLRELG
jgi:GNAT superfamily N-acetyltransferase